jgi:adenylate kinase
VAPVILLMGPTGAGKSLQAAKLAERHGWAFLSMGELLRQYAPDEVLATLDSGELAPVEVAERLLREAIGSVPSGRPVVLDGYPRTQTEMGWFDQQLPDLNRQITQVFYIKISHEVSLARIEGRQRRDDNRQVSQRKWQIFQDQVLPVIEGYRTRGLVTDIDGAQAREAVSADIEKGLGHVHHR